MSPRGRDLAGRQRGLSMEELLFGCTPAEWWAWCYLLFLAEKQGSAPIILPRPGEDPRAEAIFGRKHLKNILKSLRSKRHLTNLIFPRSKNKRIELRLPASKIGELQFLNVEKGLLEFPKKEGRGNHSSPITPLGNHSSAIEEVISATLPESTPSQAKLKESLKALIKQKQGDLIEAILKMKGTEVYQMRVGLRCMCRYEAKGSYSEQARLFAAVRFIQETGN